MGYVPQKILNITFSIKPIKLNKKQKHQSTCTSVIDPKSTLPFFFTLQIFSCLRHVCDYVSVSHYDWGIIFACGGNKCLQNKTQLPSGLAVWLGDWLREAVLLKWVKLSPILINVLESMVGERKFGMEISPIPTSWLREAVLLKWLKLSPIHK